MARSRKKPKLAATDAAAARVGGAAPRASVSKKGGARKAAAPTPRRAPADIDARVQALERQLGEAGGRLEAAVREATARVRALAEEVARAAEAVRQLARDARREEREAPPAAEAEGKNRLGVTVAPGVVVAEVMPGSLAAAARLAAGDVILSVNGAPVLTGPELREVVAKAPAGEEMQFRVARGGSTTALSARLGPAPEGEEEAANRLGVTVVPGVVVTEVLPGSPAAAARLAAGDVITGVNGAPVLSGPELRAAIAPLEERAEVRLRVTRAGKERELKARLDG